MGPGTILAKIAARTRRAPFLAALVDSADYAVGVAQLVELLVVVQAVVGSSPIAHPQEFRWYSGVFGVLEEVGWSAVSINCPSIFCRRCGAGGRCRSTRHLRQAGFRRARLAAPWAPLRTFGSARAVDCSVDAQPGFIPRPGPALAAGVVGRWRVAMIASAQRVLCPRRALQRRLSYTGRRVGARVAGAARNDVVPPVSRSFSHASIADSRKHGNGRVERVGSDPHVPEPRPSRSSSRDGPRSLRPLAACPSSEASCRGRGHDCETAPRRSRLSRDAPVARLRPRSH